MIVLKKDEELRRTYPAKLAKIGKGTFYITSNRIMFEHEKKGACFNLDMHYLYNWEVNNKKKKIKIRWQEGEERKFNMYSANPFEAEFEFDKKNGEKIEIEEVHYAMFYAIIDMYQFGLFGSGFYRSADGSLHNHFFANLKKEPIPLNNEKDSIFMIRKIEQFKMCNHDETCPHRENAGDDYGCKHISKLASCNGNEIICRYIENTYLDLVAGKKFVSDSGEKLVHYERKKHYEIWKALVKDGLASYEFGWVDEEDWKHLTDKNYPRKAFGTQEYRRKKLPELEDQLKKLEEGGSREEFKKYAESEHMTISYVKVEGTGETEIFIEPYMNTWEKAHFERTGERPKKENEWNGGTLHEFVKYESDAIKGTEVANRINENRPFRTRTQVGAYNKQLFPMIMDKLSRGEDLSDFNPEIEMAPVYFDLAKIEIEKYKEKLVETAQ